jgi:hypothetical protein
MGKERRDYPEICNAVLKALDRPKTVNEVAGDIDAGWETVERALDFLESICYVESIVDKPRKIYKKRCLFPLPERFIKELCLIINKKGSRYHSIDDCLDDALREFIHREKRIKRY